MKIEEMKISMWTKSRIASDTTTKKKRKEEMGTDHTPGILSQDLVETVLSKLPVKSLVRFRRVCKSWQSLTSDAWFIKKQHESAPLSLISFAPIGNALDLFNIDRKGNIEQQKPTLKQEFANFCLQSNSINGLTCQASFKNEVYLLNPSIREIVKLPPAGNYPGMKGSEFKLPMSIGLGFDDCTGKYTLVMMYCYFPENMAKYPCMVLIVGIDNEWRYVGDSPYCTTSEKAVFLNGAIHWKVDTPVSEFRVLAFDLKDEKFRTIHCPEGITTSGIFLSSIHLIGVGAYVSLVVEDGKFLNIWMLNDYEGCNWRKEYAVDTSGPNWKRLEHFNLIGIKDGKIMLKGMRNDSESLHVFCSYDLCADVLKVSRIPFSMLRFYSESLVSPFALL